MHRDTLFWSTTDCPTSRRPFFSACQLCVSNSNHFQKWVSLRVCAKSAETARGAVHLLATLRSKNNLNRHEVRNWQLQAKGQALQYLQSSRRDSLLNCLTLGIAAPPRYSDCSSAQSPATVKIFSTNHSHTARENAILA